MDYRYAPARVLTRAQVRNVDYYAIHHLGYVGLVLMENAGRGVTDVVVSELKANTTIWPEKRNVLVVCAKGNNGGDGFVVARHLVMRNVPVEVILACDPGSLSGDAATNFALLRQLSVPVHRHNSSAARTWLDGSRTAELACIVDAILGTGASGPPRSPIDDLIVQLNQLNARRIAIDLPSGLDCDTGQVSHPTFQADITCTLVAFKPGLLVSEAQPYVGRTEVLDIGLPWSIVEDAMTWEIKNAC